MGSLWFILGGVVLRLNPEWFNGASSIGLVLLIFGGLIAIFEVIIFFGAISAFFKNW